MEAQRFGAGKNWSFGLRFVDLGFRDVGGVYGEEVA